MQKNLQLLPSHPVFPALTKHSPSSSHPRSPENGIARIGVPGSGAAKVTSNRTSRFGDRSPLSRGDDRAYLVYRALRGERPNRAGRAAAFLDTGWRLVISPDELLSRAEMPVRAFPAA